MPIDINDLKVGDYIFYGDPEDHTFKVEIVRKIYQGSSVVTTVVYPEEQNNDPFVWSQVSLRKLARKLSDLEAMAFLWEKGNKDGKK